MTRRILVCTVATMVFACRSVLAGFCAYDAAPAASLLFPFAAVDLGDSLSGITTEIAITNVSSEAQVVRVTLWTDFGEPIFSFNVVLSGFDIQVIDLRNIIVDGYLPVTYATNHTETEGSLDLGPVSTYAASAGDWIEGLLPDPEAAGALRTANPARCTMQMDGYPGRYSQSIPQSMLEVFRQLLRTSQTAHRAFSDDCAPPFTELLPWSTYDWFTERSESAPVWLYVTADVVHTCDRSTPLDDAYWLTADQGGVERYDNVLVGDMTWRSAAGAASGPAVHIEADRENWRVTSRTPAGQPVSFYHSYSTRRGLPSDRREPLPTAWAVRYTARVDDSGNWGSKTHLRVWKGPTTRSQLADLAILPDGAAPTSLIATNCGAYTFYAWDEEENVVTGSWLSSSDWNMLPLASQEVPVDTFTMPERKGWMLFVWPPANYSGDEAPTPPDHYQTWMGVANDAWSPHATFHDGIPVGNANCFPDQVLPQLGVNYDYVTSDGYRTGYRPPLSPPDASE